MSFDNPYRTDFPGQGPFVGRRDELDTLGTALLRGRRSIAAVMGGRGVGKTSLALTLEHRLRSGGLDGVRVIRKPDRDPLQFFNQLGKALGARLDPMLPTESIVDHVRRSGQRVALLIDEIEHLLDSPGGQALLDNLRIAWEQLLGQLGIVVFGGSKLRKLLIADASPFLRSAQWFALRGLDRRATAELVTQGLPEASVPTSDDRGTPTTDLVESPTTDLVESLWEATCGHPLLLQGLLEETFEAMEREGLDQPSVEGIRRRLPTSAATLRRQRFDTTLFPLWWENLTPLGQEIYRRLLRETDALAEDRWAERLGPDPWPWVEVLETTGVARVEDGELLARGELFHQWFRRQQERRGGHRATAVSPPPKPSSDHASVGDDPERDFERRVVTAIERWTRDAHELPTFALKSGRASGNDRLLPEHHFQLVLAMALRQHDLLVEAEALSSTRGRVDLKIRCRRRPDDRACIELKIWGRNDFADTVDQLLGYTLPTDRFGGIVMIDRQAAPLAERYHERVLDAGTRGRRIEPEPTLGPYVAFVTEHERPAAEPFRLYHFLIQLPA